MRVVLKKTHYQIHTTRVLPIVAGSRADGFPEYIIKRIALPGCKTGVGKRPFRTGKIEN